MLKKSFTVGNMSISENDEPETILVTVDGREAVLTKREWEALCHLTTYSITSFNWNGDTEDRTDTII